MISSETYDKINVWKDAAVDVLDKGTKATVNFTGKVLYNGAGLPATIAGKADKTMRSINNYMTTGRMRHVNGTGAGLTLAAVATVLVAGGVTVLFVASGPWSVVGAVGLIAAGVGLYAAGVGVALYFNNEKKKKQLDESDEEYEKPINSERYENLPQEGDDEDLFKKTVEQFEGAPQLPPKPKKPDDNSAIKQN